MRMTNILPGAYTNSHVLNVARHMLTKQAVVSLRDFMYTIFLVGITIQLQNLHNISWNTATILVTWRSPCIHMDTLEKFYIHKRNYRR